MMQEKIFRCIDSDKQVPASSRRLSTNEKTRSVFLLFSAGAYWRELHRLAHSGLVVSAGERLCWINLLANVYNWGVLRNRQHSLRSFRCAQLAAQTCLSL